MPEGSCPEHGPISVSTPAHAMFATHAVFAPSVGATSIPGIPGPRSEGTVAETPKAERCGQQTRDDQLRRKDLLRMADFEDRFMKPIC